MSYAKATSGRETATTVNSAETSKSDSTHNFKFIIVNLNIFLIHYCSCVFFFYTWMNAWVTINCFIVSILLRISKQINVRIWCWLTIFRYFKHVSLKTKTMVSKTAKEIKLTQNFHFWWPTISAKMLKLTIKLSRF